ncbi:MAG: hypothetical protein RLZZ505_1260 [Verrucomicrobiota bacterium]|jgi:uncharacterized membrane protein YqjE
MIENSGNAPSDEPQANANRVAGGTGTARGNWVEAIFGLIESRSAIISLEAKDALENGLAKLVPLVICLFCVFAAWALIVVAAIGCLASVTLWKWYQITFAVAALHFMIALIALLAAKKKIPATFPVTRSEFEKDREWLIQLKNRND